MLPIRYPPPTTLYPSRSYDDQHGEQEIGNGIKKYRAVHTFTKIATCINVITNRTSLFVFHTPKAINRASLIVQPYLNLYPSGVG